MLRTATARALAARSPVRFGVDVVDLRRLEHAASSWTETYRRRVLTAQERSWVPSRLPFEDLAACIAAKESVIKALGVRPPGFSWHDVSLTPASAVPEGVPETLLVLARSLTGAVAAGGARWGSCSLAGGVLEEAVRLPEAPDGSSPARGAAAWTVTGHHVFAVAGLWWPDDDRRVGPVSSRPA